MRSAVCRLRGHDASGPSGVSDQSLATISAAISPPELMNADAFAGTDRSAPTEFDGIVCVNRWLLPRWQPWARDRSGHLTISASARVIVPRCFGLPTAMKAPLPSQRFE